MRTRITVNPATPPTTPPTTAGVEGALLLPDPEPDPPVDDGEAPSTALVGPPAPPPPMRFCVELAKLDDDADIDDLEDVVRVDEAD